MGKNRPSTSTKELKNILAQLRNKGEMGIFKINRALLPFKIHYFFKNGGMAFLSFMAPMAKDRGISARGIGIIWTVHPFVSAMCNVLCGSLADAFNMHRLILIGLCGLLTSSFTTYFFLPAIPRAEGPTANALLSVQCLTNNISLQLCFNELQDHNNSSFPDQFRTFETTKNGSWEFECFTDSQKNVDINFSPKNHYYPTENQSERCFSMNENEILGLSYSDYESACDKYINLQCKSNCKSPETVSIPMTELICTTAFWLNALCVLFVYVSIEASSSLADTMCFVVLGNNGHMYGKSRMFGSLGYGLMGASMGGLVNLVSKGKADIDYTPAMILTGVFLLINLICTATIKVDVPGKQGLNSSGIKISFPFVSMLITALITGASMGLIWAFEFIYMKTVALEWDPDFSDTNLLQGLCVAMDCFIGEVPFLFFSAYIIKSLSNMHTFSLTLAAMGIRLLLCSFVKNPWLFLVAHLFHGLSFGVYFANMVSCANLLAPKGSQATMQSITMAVFTIGKSSGSLGGGVLLENYGGSTAFLIIGLVVSIYAVLHAIIHLSHTFIRRRTQGEYQRPIEQEKVDAEQP